MKTKMMVDVQGAIELLSYDYETKKWGEKNAKIRRNIRQKWI